MVYLDYSSIISLLTCQNWYAQGLYVLNICIICSQFCCSELPISYNPVEFVSVSDLLDYINPNHDSKGRDMATKRRNHIKEVCSRFVGYSNSVEFICLITWQQYYNENNCLTAAYFYIVGYCCYC